MPREPSPPPPPPPPAPMTSLSLPEDLKVKLECPVCSRISLPPIMQCRNGHVTCNNCRMKVQQCPVCRDADIDIRNMFAEKAISYMTIPCEYQPYGCNMEIQYRDKDGVCSVPKYWALSGFAVLMTKSSVFSTRKYASSGRISAPTSSAMSNWPPTPSFNTCPRLTGKNAGGQTDPRSPPP